MATFYGYNEEGLEFLYDCTNEQLDFLVQLITTKGNLSELMTGNTLYRDNAPNHRKYVNLITDEIISFGSNSFSLTKNTYRQILMKVCNKLKVDYNSSESTWDIEDKLLAKVFGSVWDKMSESEIKAVIESFDESNKDDSNLLSILPIPIPIWTAIKTLELAEPAYRVIVPVVIYIAALRRIHENG